MKVETEFKYREGRPEDAEAIRDFQVAMAREIEGMALDPATCLRGVRAVFERPAETQGRYWVIEGDGGVVGCTLVLKEWSDWRDGFVWWIHSLYVRPELRGKGAFEGLFARLKSEAERDGARGIRLYVDERNSAAQAVYRRVGMNGDHYRVFEWMRAELGSQPG